MGRLAEAAKTAALKGKVTVTDAAGLTRTYADEAAADAAIPVSAGITHRRGAFFLAGESAPVEEAPKPSRRRRRASSEDSD